MKILRDVLIALAGIILTILFDFATVGFVDPAKLDDLKKDQTKLLEFLAVPFDLWLVSFSLLIGAVVTTSGEKRARLAWPIIWALGFLIATIASLALSAVLPATYHNWFKIYMPDILGLALIGYAAHSALENA